MTTSLTFGGGIVVIVFPIPLPPVPQVVSHFKVFFGAKRARVDGILTIFLWRTRFFL
jgi:hypothetical protein